MTDFIIRLKNKINSDVHLKELLKGSSIAFVLRIVGIIAGYIFTLLITRGYGAEAMGIFALSFTLLQISSIIGRLGMDTALLRFVAEYSSQGKWEVVKDIYEKAIKLVIPFSLFISVLVFLLSPYIAEYIFKKPHLAPYFRIASIGIVPFVLLFIHTESLRGLKKIKEYMFLQQIGIFILASIILGVLTLSAPFLWTGVNLNKLPIIVYILSIFIISVIAYFVWKKYLKKESSQTEKESVFIATSNSLSYSYILSVSIPMLFSSSLALIMGWTDTIMLGIFRTEEEVGIYAILVKVSTMISFLLLTINSIAAPKFVELLINKSTQKLQVLINHYMKIVSFVSILLFVVICAYAEEILAIFGENFLYGKNGLCILSLGQLFNVLAGSTGYFLSMSGKQKIFLYFLLTSTIINIIGNFFLIPLWGIIGAAISSSFTIVIWNLLAVIYIEKTYKIKTYYFPRGLR